MYNNTYDLGTMMSSSIVMGLVMVWLFGKMAHRDSDYWDKSYERKEMKITRIVLMCIWGIYIVAPFLGLIFSWNSIRDNQKVSYMSHVMLGISLFYYELTLRQSPRGTWVKIRKVIAYTLICSLYAAVWPTTVLQLTTGKIPGVYGNAWGTILVVNALIYGIFILIIWLLLKQYKRDKYIPYNQHENKKEPTIDKDIHERAESLCHEDHMPEQDFILNPIQKTETDEKDIKDECSNVNIKEPVVSEERTMDDVVSRNTRYKTSVTKSKSVIIDKVVFVIKSILEFLKRIWKWILGFVLLAALVNGGIALYKYLHDVYVPKKKLDKAATEIIENFNAKETGVNHPLMTLTRTDYACNILKKDYDWGYEHIKYKGHISGNKYIKDRLSDYWEEAFLCIENNAYQGDAACQYYLGRLYYWGNEKYYYMGEQDKEKAAYWWLESAQNGYVRAYNNIGICYKKGSGVPLNMYKAIEWLKKGAEAGEPYAQKNYGDLFLEGVRVHVGSHYEREPYYDYTGYSILWYEKVEVDDYKTLIPIDIEQAKYWWKKSAAQGNEGAKERLQKIYE